MLGRALVHQFGKTDIEVHVASRSGPIPLDVSEQRLAQICDDLALGTGDFVINAVGLVKSQISTDSFSSVELAIRANSLFPLFLASASEKRGFNVLSPATDCVFSGHRGFYSEASFHDAEDVYGKSKSLGEVKSHRTLTIRSSFVGPELGSSKMLVEWIRSQASGVSLLGYIDHLWNGVSVDALARIFVGIIRNKEFSPGTFHLKPADSLTKFELIELLAARLGRTDLKIIPHESGARVNRVLATDFEEVNQAFWTAGGHLSVPTISELIDSMPIEVAF